MRKHSSLGQILFATSVGATQGAVRLTLEQQQAFARGLQRGGTFSPVLSPEAFLFTLRPFPQSSEMARSWMTLTVATQARLMNAWADFWLLPSSANSSA
jgi:hypothetical protein